MEKRTLTLVLKISSLFIFSGIAFVLLLSTGYLMKHTFLLLIYPFIFVSLLARAILAYFGQTFNGDYLFLFSVWISRLFGLYYGALFLVAVLIFYFGRMIASRLVMLHYVLTLLISFGVIFLGAMSLKLSSVFAYAVYGIATYAGYRKFKGKTWNLWVDLGSNLAVLLSGLISMDYVMMLV